MRGVAFAPLARVAVPKGDVLHGLKRSDESYCGFGEAYFTSIDFRAVKGWRRHRSMVLNLIVPVGAVRFVACEGNDQDEPSPRMQAYDLSGQPEAYGRLTVSPGVWLAFQGMGEQLNLILNIASITHDPAESQARPLETFHRDWSL